MPDRLSIHAPILVNTLGHCAGVIIFGILFYLLVLDLRRNRGERDVLPGVAAALALLWNAGSLIALATPERGAPLADAIVAGSFSVLSLLPAVLLHISLRASPEPAGRRFLWMTGYAVSGAAVVLHLSDLVTSAPRFHYAALLLVTVGFGLLTTVTVARESLAGQSEAGQSLAGKPDGSGARLAGAMVLFLFAISFVHFETARDMRWSGEAALHHAGIPLALFVLLQDYRFLLLDAFVRFLVNAGFAALSVGAAYEANAKLFLLERAERDPFHAGLIFVGACLMLSLFVYLRSRVQRWLTRVVFLRANTEKAATEIREMAAGKQDEAAYLEAAGACIAEFLSAPRFELAVPGAGPFPQKGLPETAITVVDPERWGVPEWVQALATLRFARGDARLVLLGTRSGGRRYLSEDIEALDRLAAILCEQVERIRSSEMQNLVSQAELRALQAQINPHFFFNALNTLYGTIARENAAARRLVTNLADLFRYSFAADRVFIRLDEEMKMVRAYLEIEELRLGPKLEVRIEVDADLLGVEVPVLSIQPLVENAVKHGAASRPGGGFVGLAIRRSGDAVEVRVSNSGPFLQVRAEDAPGTGMGLDNVRRRLALCYGPVARLDVDSSSELTSVRFSVPILQQVPIPEAVGRC
jgi:hypothetical protein